MWTRAELETRAQRDFFCLTGGRRFSPEAQAQILDQLELKQREATSPVTDDMWRAWVVDFHRTGHWGVASLSPGTQAAPTPPKPTSMFRFIWSAFQSLIILKAFVLYFGLSYAIDSTRLNLVGLVVSIAVSFGSLLWFAIRQSRHDEEK